MYVCRVWISPKADKKKLITFERKILRRNFGSKMNTENNNERELFNETVISVLKSRSLSWQDMCGERRLKY